MSNIFRRLFSTRSDISRDPNINKPRTSTTITEVLNKLMSSIKARFVGNMVVVWGWSKISFIRRVILTVWNFIKDKITKLRAWFWIDNMDADTMNQWKSAHKKFYSQELRELLLLETGEETQHLYDSIEQLRAVLLKHVDKGYIDNDIDKLLPTLYPILLEIILEKANDSNRATFDKQFVVDVVVFAEELSKLLNNLQNDYTLKYTSAQDIYLTQTSIAMHISKFLLSIHPLPSAIDTWLPVAESLMDKFCFGNQSDISHGPNINRPHIQKVLNEGTNSITKFVGNMVTAWVWSKTFFIRRTILTVWNFIKDKTTKLIAWFGFGIDSMDANTMTRMMSRWESAHKKFHSKKVKELLSNTVTEMLAKSFYDSIERLHTVLLKHVDNGYRDNDIDKLLLPLYPIVLEIILEKTKDSNRASFNKQFVVDIVIFAKILHTLLNDLQKAYDSKDGAPPYLAQASIATHIASFLLHNPYPNHLPYKKSVRSNSNRNNVASEFCLD